MSNSIAGLAAGLELKRDFFERNREAIRGQAMVLAATLRGEGKLLAFGNGGSAADANRAAACLLRRGDRKSVV